MTLYLHRIALILSVTLISCIPCCFMNHVKENKRIPYIVKLTNKGNKTFLSSFFFFCLYQTFNKKLITPRNSTHYKEFITVFIRLSQRIKNLSYKLSSMKQDVYTFLFCFLRLSCNHFSHSSRHPYSGLSTSSLILR